MVCIGWGLKWGGGGKGMEARGGGDVLFLGGWWRCDVVKLFYEAVEDVYVCI